MSKKPDSTNLEIKLSNPAAFTLVELLVVIAIIALLMAILMPALTRAGKQAKAVLCQSNLKQWASVYAMYTGDYDGRFMEGWKQHLPTYPEHYWMQALRPYYGNQHDLRLCPRATLFESEVGYTNQFTAWGIFPSLDDCGEPASHWPSVTACDYGSYGMNSFVNDPPPQEQIIQGHPTSNNWRTTNVKGTQNIPLLGDEQWIDCWPHHTDQPPDYDGMPWWTDHWVSMYRICMNRHEGYVNWLFLDYSVHKIGIKQLWKLKWHRTFDLSAGPTKADWPEWMKPFKEYK